ncbi:MULTISPECIES: MFS transporter [unclassified Sphingomonas]|uniref:MFS transporter n=1 Tax=unclassified Sphingomonas TaxID=196159 RepID=UPI000FED1E55|nr:MULTISPECIES: MFS transporter [unclassified Sphingomonas]RKE44672.1 ACS family hexuronate transporter-like MFS transporter [Sphingomonas sp. PP-CC-1A-547]TCM06259.1 ACS family hexuronate transporter-like MFS transporter [Sphingomonas sp. PP-CC-3G-468]
MRRFRNIRWTIIGLFVVAMVINYLARSVLGVAAPAIMAEQHISAAEYSWITGAFQIGIMFQPLAGYVLDVVGLKIGFTLFVALWSLITMAHGLATGWMGFAGLRGALGLVEGSAQPAGMKLVAEWFPARERGVAGGIYQIGASFGAVFAPPLVAWAVLNHSWRAAFFIAGALGLVWVIAWLFWYAPPAKHRRLSPAERTLIVEGQEASLATHRKRPPLGELLRRRNLWAIAAARFLADPVWGMLSFWMPLYLVQVRHFDLGQIAMFAWLPFLAADLGCLFGPIVVAWLQRRGVDLIDARRGAFTVGAVLMTGMMFVGTVTSPIAAIALLCLGGFAHQTLSVTVITLSSDLFPQDQVATATGMSGTAANLGVLIFTLVLGSMVAEVGYQPFFILLGLLDLVGAALLWVLIRKPA